MTTFTRSSSCWVSRTKVGLALTLLVSQMSVQAAPGEPDPPDISNANNSSNSGPVIVSTEKGKNPNKHRNTKRGPSKPEQYPTKPQQQIPNLR
jgi:hypothetical protein